MGAKIWMLLPFEDSCPEIQAEPWFLSRGAQIIGMMLGCVLRSFMSITSGSLHPGPALQWAAPGARVFDEQVLSAAGCGHAETLPSAQRHQGQ